MSNVRVARKTRYSENNTTVQFDSDIRLSYWKVFSVFGVMNYMKNVHSRKCTCFKV